MQATGIEWTDFSANLLKYLTEHGKPVWACAKVSDGCKNCYAEAMAERFGRGGPFSLQQVREVTPFFDIAEAKKLVQSKKLDGKRVFIDDMTDLFGEWVPDEIIDKHFALFALRPDVTFQILTKRPERMAKYLGEHDVGLNWAMRSVGISNDQSLPAITAEIAVDWTRHGLPNVWLGTSCEDQQRADERIPHLLRCPAAVRFLSCEPLLGPIDLEGWLLTEHQKAGLDSQLISSSLSGERRDVHWIIVGGESGAKARPCDIEWVRSIVRQCKAADTACFVKQLGSHPVVWDCGAGDEFTPDAPGYGPLGYGGRPIADRKGGDISEFPIDLRVREMPEAKVTA
jgi:protein gp37